VKLHPFALDPSASEAIDPADVPRARAKLVVPGTISTSAAGSSRLLCPRVASRASWREVWPRASGSRRGAVGTSLLVGDGDQVLERVGPVHLTFSATRSSAAIVSSLRRNNLYRQLPLSLAGASSARKNWSALDAVVLSMSLHLDAELPATSSGRGDLGLASISARDLGLAGVAGGDIGLAISSLGSPSHPPSARGVPRPVAGRAGGSRSN